MKSRMTLRMGKMLEARTAPGNQRRTAAKKKKKEAKGEWDVILVCTKERRGEENSQRGHKEKGEVAAASAGMKEVMNIKQRERETKREKAH